MTWPGGMVSPEEVSERVAGIRAVIEQASTDPRLVQLTAVTKGFGIEMVRSVAEAGVVDLGENYADELLAKAGRTTSEGLATRWHFLGAIQRNKVPRLAPVVSCWQGIGRIEEARAIAARRPGSRVLVQVELFDLPGRGGCRPEDASGLVEQVRDEDLELAGLMTVGPPGPPEKARFGFRRLSMMADRFDLPVRSMGMSDDFEVALEEGSTMLRIGRGLFGERSSLR